MKLHTLVLALAFAGLTISSTTPAQAVLPVHQMMATKSSVFKGAEVNGGTASLVMEGDKHVLRLSADFKIPKAPAPHFRVIDADGNVFLLARLTIVGNKTHREVVLPSYIKSVTKVQIWCSFAEVVLGEASFGKPIIL